MARFVDCSHTIEDGMVTYPGIPGPRIAEYLTREASRANYEPGTEFVFGSIEMIGNTSTYLDTPYHRFAEGFDLADLGLASVADLPGLCVRSSAQAVTAGLLGASDVRGRAVLFCTGWDEHWRTERYGDPDHPFLADDTVEVLVDGGAALVGIDSVNVDATTSGARPAHTRLLDAGIPVVEHLTGLDRLVGADFRFFAVPPKVRAFGTYPVRAFAIVT